MDLTSLKRALGMIQVTESGDQIKLTGLPGGMAQRDIADVWGTTRLANQIFSHIGSSDVSFNRWFAPDVIYILQKLMAQGERRHNVRALERIIEQMYEHTWLKNTQAHKPDILDFSQLHKFHFAPLPHQDGFFKTYNYVVPRYLLNGYLLAAGPGTGKTFMGLALAEMLHADIVIMLTLKNAVHRVWYNSVRGEGDAKKDCLFKNPPPCWTSLDGTPPPRKGCRHYVIHFDGMEKFANELQHLPHSRAVILLDESHNLNDDESFRADQYFRICHTSQSHHILHGSGTPVKAVGGEVTTLFKVIDPMFDQDAETRFKAIYGKASGVANDILAARLGRVSYKVESKNVVKATGHSHQRPIKIPDGDKYTLKTIKTEMQTFVKERAKHYLDNMRMYERQYEDILRQFERTLATKEQKKEYETYRAYIYLIKKKYDPSLHKQEAIFCNEYEKHQIIPTLSKKEKELFRHVRSIVKYYKLKVQGEALGQILGKKRAECIAAMVPYVEWEHYIDTALKKTLVFSSYVTVVDAIVAYLKGKGYHSGVVYGDTSNELASIVATFGRDPDMNPLVATYASLSTAVPIVMANEMIMMNSPFRSYERDQAVARCVRQGQDQDVNIEDIFLDTGEEPNISTRSRDILAWSRQQVEEILDFKNPSFAMESYGQHLITKLPEREFWVAMEEFLEGVDGFQGLHEWASQPDWANGW